MLTLASSLEILDREFCSVIFWKSMVNEMLNGSASDRSCWVDLVGILPAPVAVSGAKKESLRQASQRRRSQDGAMRWVGPALTHAGAEVLPLGPRLPPFQSMLAPLVLSIIQKRIFLNIRRNKYPQHHRFDLPKAFWGSILAAMMET